MVKEYLGVESTRPTARNRTSLFPNRKKRPKKNASRQSVSGKWDTGGSMDNQEIYSYQIDEKERKWEAFCEKQRDYGMDSMLGQDNKREEQ